LLERALHALRVRVQLGLAVAQAALAGQRVVEVARRALAREAVEELRGDRLALGAVRREEARQAKHRLVLGCGGGSSDLGHAGGEGRRWWRGGAARNE